MAIASFYYVIDYDISPFSISHCSGESANRIFSCKLHLYKYCNRIKMYIKIEWNVQIPMLVLIKRVKTKYLLLEQKKFQNKSKNICEVYQSESFRCIMSLSYRGTFLCNVLEQTQYTSESPVRYFFMKKL